MKRRLLICIESLRIGGAERLIAEQLYYWDTHLWDIFLMTFSENVEVPAPLERIREHVVLGELSNVGAVFEAYRYCRRKKIDIAITHLERPNKWLGVGARFAGAHVVSVVHNIGIYDSKSTFKKALLRRFYCRVPERVVAVSDGVFEYLREFGLDTKHVEVIPNGVDGQRLRERWGNNAKYGMNLGFLGRLEPVKGLDLLLKALSRLIDYPWTLKIIGDGSSRSFLENLASELRILDRIAFLGSQREPFSCLSDVDAVCMPSRSEGLPMSLLECQALGLPVIVSDVGYLPRMVVDGRNGFVCQAESIDSLQDALKRFFVADPEMRQLLSRNALQLANSYDIKSCVDRYMALAESICEKD